VREHTAPLFLYLAYQAMHSPTQAPVEYIAKFNETIELHQRQTVAAMVSCMDEVLHSAFANLIIVCPKPVLANDPCLLRRRHPISSICSCI